MTRVSMRRLRARLGTAWVCVVLGAMLAMLPSPAGAASLNITPTSLELPAGTRTAALRLANSSDEPTDVQIQAFVWTHDAAGDHLTPTTDLAASPPFVHIGGGASQTVRVGLRVAPLGPTYYRLSIAEISAPTTPGAISLMINFSVPVAADAQRVQAPILEWRGLVGGGGLDLLAVNRSPWHANIRDLTVETASGQTMGARLVGSFPTVLPGQERRWVVAGAGGAAGGSLIVRGVVNGTPFVTTVAAAAR